jgi:hypothetical protein
MEHIKKNFGFGCMRLPMKDGEVDIEQTCRMVDAFLENGFNYFDTAHGYPADFCARVGGGPLDYGRGGAICQYARQTHWVARYRIYGRHTDHCSISFPMYLYLPTAKEEGSISIKI